MIPELGHFALILALVLALVQATLPLVGSFTGNRNWMNAGRSLAYGQLVFLTLAILALIHAFLADDFSVRYVAANSNSLLPDVYKVSAVWGAHEGSLLLWALMLGAWGAAVAALSKSLPLTMVARVLAVMGMNSIGFLLFMLLTSNPFERLFPAPLDGRDLNPLLQDPGLVIHPPMLYMGYVGFSVAFAFAIAALIGGKLDSAWARWSRPWTTVAWGFLTIGIALGSWWAYYELGWGGWWFWDPVENASLLPWILGTALLHSLAVTEKRGAFKSWTVLLALSTYALVLLGAFLVRSGVLTSVHAFATDPARGTYILMFLCVVVGGSLALYAWRAPAVSGGGRFTLVSRESFLLANNLLLVLLCSLVLLGTLAPLVYEALSLGKISVGFPWFNKMFVAVTPFIALALGAGVLARWKQDDAWRLVQQLRVALILTGLVLVATMIPFFSHGYLWVPIGITLAAWVLFSHLASLVERWRNKVRLGGGILADFGSHSRSYYGMWVAHVGVAVFIVGITMVSHFEVERDVRVSPGDYVEVAGYRFQFEGSGTVPGPNYSAQQGLVNVYSGDRLVTVLRPEKRTYFVSSQVMTQAAIRPGLFRDLYVSLGEPLGNGDWSMRVYYKPYVRWIWLGSILMALGGVIAISDRRYRLATRAFKAPKGAANARA
ncbi:heme lyase CcmF/NrfE family subunit [Thioalkalicoccus limnaeus]|uniref:Heme lyase CcmF/NrfE family subunit n=1 Tax=Thioalkalicoccus limnaeus TaxID=120681 RepID=A0ABV4BB28_9GAMM